MGNYKSSRASSDYEELRKEEARERERHVQERYDRDRRNLEEELNRISLENKESEKVKQELKEKLQKAMAEIRTAEERKVKEPWRKFERNGGWNIEYHDRLMKEVQAQRIHGGELERARLLVMGPISAGKSSFINSVATIDNRRISCVVDAGAATKSLSTTFTQYIPRNIIQNCILMDTMGVEEQEEEGFNVQDVFYLIEGHVRPSYRFNPRIPITEKDSFFLTNPTLADKVHCVVIVMDSTVIDSDSITDASKKKIEALQKHIRRQAVPAVLVLTKIDELCEEVARDITTTYHSRAVESVVQKSHELFGIQKLNIFPVKNYSHEIEVNELMNILILLALRKMMHVASDRLATNADNQFTETVYSERRFKQEIQENEKTRQEELEGKEQILQKINTEKQHLQAFEAEKQEAHELWQLLLDETEKIRNQLIKEKKAPIDDALIRVDEIYNRQSTVRDICQRVSDSIRTHSNKIVDVWPAYRYDKHVVNQRKDHIVFVVVTKSGTEKLDIPIYNIYQRSETECNAESEKCNSKELCSELLNQDFGPVLSCVRSHAKSLLQTHAKLSMVSASCIKSKKFGTSEEETKNIPCLVLYTHIKGLIPISEQPFPEEIEGVPVDVREAVFLPSCGGPFDHHEHLKMGCAIRSEHLTPHGDFIYGTLGGFVDHPKHGVCGLTCAHVIFPDFKSMTPLSSRSLRWNGHQHSIILVFQPITQQSMPFGNVVEAIYDNGDENQAGIDAVLIKVFDRIPNDGDFPYTQTFVDNGFSTNSPMMYKRGGTYDCSLLKRNTVVFKYGATSQVTRGVFRLQGSGVNRTSVNTDNPGFRFFLQNQLEILTVGEGFFSTGGDSGALVFVEDNDELIAIGIVEGHMTDKRSIVTPINDVLNGLEMPPGSHLKQF